MSRGISGAVNREHRRKWSSLPIQVAVPRSQPDIPTGLHYTVPQYLARGGLLLCQGISRDANSTRASCGG